MILSAIFYVEMGLAIHNQTDDVRFYNEYWENPIGLVEIGVEQDNMKLYWKHESSVPQNDKGLNEIGVKVRVLEWK